MIADPLKLPDPLASVAVQFDHSGWRERKQAAAEFVRLAGTLPRDGEGFRTVVQYLIDEVESPRSVDTRAVAQEVLSQLGAPALPGVLERLHSSDVQVRLLVQLLGILGSAVEIPLLIELLADPTCDENTRAAIATALGAIGGEGVKAPLISLLEDPSSMIVLHALDALRVASVRVPVANLLPTVAAAVTRKAAAYLLGASGSLDAVPVLVPLLSDSMRGVRAAACVALVRVDAATGVRLSSSVRDALSSADENTKERIRELVGHPDRDVYSAAIAVAAMVGDPAALPAMLQHIDDPLVHDHVLDFVARIGPAANRALVELLAGVDASSRESLFRLIGAVAVDVVDPRLLSALMEGLDDPTESVACAASDGLRRVGGRTALAPLYRACAIEGSLGEQAAEALAEVAHRIGGGRYDELSLIIGGSWPQQGGLARNLCRVVGRLGLEDYVPPLVALLGSRDEGVRVAAAHALGRIGGDHEGVGALCFALADEEPGVRAAACRSLGESGSAQGFQPLLGATTDPVPLVRSAAVQALVLMDNPVALARLREIVLDDGTTSVVVHAIAGLGASRQEQDLTLLMSLCLSQDYEVIKAAARALTRYSAHRATAALLGLIGHPRWDVRWAAAEVLAMRGDPTALAPLKAARAEETDALVGGLLDQAIERLGRISGAEPAT